MELIVGQITSSIETFSYFAIFLLMTLESALIPIPSEVTMTFAGFLVGQGKLGFWLVVLVGTFANLLGSLVAYRIGLWSEGKLYVWVRKYGKFLLITLGEVERAERWFRSHGELVTFGSRLLPVVRTFISLPAGVARMNVKKFTIYTLLGSFLWSTLLAYIGVVLGRNWQSIETYTRPFQVLIIAVFAILALWYIWHKVKKIRAQ